MDFFELIYDSLQGLLTEEAAVPGVENAFSKGSDCERHYTSARDAYDRICIRLGLDPDDEDDDLNSLIDALEYIQKDLCRRMFLYGMKYVHTK